VKLDLVDGGDDGGDFEQTVEELDGEVGDTDGLDLVGVRLVDALHVLPGVEPVVRVVRLAITGHGCRPVHQP
jgi:hypothetical protein